jgi:hypothetical protein
MICVKLLIWTSVAEKAGYVFFVTESKFATLQALPGF